MHFARWSIVTVSVKKTSASEILRCFMRRLDFVTASVNVCRPDLGCPCLQKMSGEGHPLMTALLGIFSRAGSSSPCEGGGGRRGVWAAWHCTRRRQRLVPRQAHGGGSSRGKLLDGSSSTPSSRLDTEAQLCWVAWGWVTSKARVADGNIDLSGSRDRRAKRR